MARQTGETEPRPRHDWGVEVARFLRFSVIGFVNFAIYASTAFTLIEFAGMSAVKASLIAQAAAILVTYLGHMSYSFRVEPKHRAYVWRFMIVIALLFAMNAAISWLLSDVFGQPAHITIPVVMIVIPVSSFLLNRLWVFEPGMRTGNT